MHSQRHPPGWTVAGPGKGLRRERHEYPQGRPGGPGRKTKEGDRGGGVGICGMYGLRTRRGGTKEDEVRSSEHWVVPTGRGGTC